MIKSNLATNILKNKKAYYTVHSKNGEETTVKFKKLHRTSFMRKMLRELKLRLKQELKRKQTDMYHTQLQ